MRIALLLIGLCVWTVSYGQDDERLSTIDFVKILNDNTEEAVFYYQNNWQMLREMALEKGYIQSYELLETPISEDAPFHLMLITTYPNKEQYDLMEDHFAELIEDRGPLKLLNEVEPGEFREIIFYKEMVKHLK